MLARMVVPGSDDWRLGGRDTFGRFLHGRWWSWCEAIYYHKLNLSAIGRVYAAVILTPYVVLSTQCAPSSAT